MKTKTIRSLGIVLTLLTILEIVFGVYVVLSLEGWAIFLLGHPLFWVYFLGFVLTLSGAINCFSSVSHSIDSNDSKMS